MGNICQNWRACGVPCPYITCGPRTGRPGASKREDGELPMSAMPARLVLAIASILAIAVGALAEEAYPARPITMVVTFAAGGSSKIPPCGETRESMDEVATAPMPAGTEV
jgi:hypothetical protein